VVICVNVVPPAVMLTQHLLAVSVVPPCTAVALSGTVLPIEVVEDWAAVGELIMVVNELTVCKTVAVETKLDKLLDETLDSVVVATATYRADD